MRDFQLPGRSAVYSTTAMAATSHPLATKTALDILQAGGNAMDAAIAAAVLQGIAEPQMTGIGGDCFVLFTPPGEDRVLAMNGSGKAPMGRTAAAMRAAGHDVVPKSGALSVTIPNAIDAFCRLSEAWGRLGIDRILQPAIAAAEKGIPVAPRTQRDWSNSQGNLTGIARDFFLLDGRVPNVGDLFRAPGQANVLRRVASQGRAGFYEGEVAEDLVASLQAAGGEHTLDDFAEVESFFTEPISGEYKNVELVEHPPNGQGATALLLNNILGHFDLPSMDPFGSERAHIEAEAAKLAYDARNRFVADPGYATKTDYMCAPETAAKLAALIRRDAVIDAPASVTEQVHKETICLSVVDKDGMKVSLIYSIFSDFGSGLASDKFGVLFHNRGSGFSLEEGHPNEANPGKRPLHTIIPGMLREGGRVTVSFGVMGGGYQPNGHARFMSNMIDFGMDLQSAIDAPRSFHWDGMMKVENGYSDKVLQELNELGHPAVRSDGPIGGAQAIRIDHERGVLEGASDPRKDGCAMGY